MEPPRILTPVTAVEPGAQVFVARRPGEETHCQGAEIEPRAAGDDGQVATSGNFAHGMSCLPGVFAGGEGLVGVGNVDEVMRQRTLLFGRGFG